MCINQSDVRHMLSKSVSCLLYSAFFFQHIYLFICFTPFTCAKSLMLWVNALKNVESNDSPLAYIKPASIFSASMTPDFCSKAISHTLRCAWARHELTAVLHSRSAEVTNKQQLSRHMNACSRSTCREEGSEGDIYY